MEDGRSTIKWRVVVDHVEGNERRGGERAEGESIHSRTELDRPEIITSRGEGEGGGRSP